MDYYKILNPKSEDDNKKDESNDIKNIKQEPKLTLKKVFKNLPSKKFKMNKNKKIA